LAYIGAESRLSRVGFLTFDEPRLVDDGTKPVAEDETGQAFPRLMYGIWYTELYTGHRDSARLARPNSTRGFLSLRRPIACDHRVDGWSADIGQTLRGV